MEGSKEVAGDFGSSGAADAIGDGDFADAQVVLKSADLHFDGPAVVAIGHGELAEGGGGEGAEGSEVGVGMAVEETDEGGGEPVAEALVREEGAGFGEVGGAGADDEVGFAGEERGEEEGGEGGVLGGVGLEEDDEVSGEEGNGGEASGAVAAGGNFDDGGAGGTGEVGSAVRGSVDGDDDLMEESGGGGGEGAGDDGFLIESRDDEADGGGGRGRH